MNNYELNSEIQSFVEMYRKFGNNEDRFIESKVIDEYEKYIEYFCKPYRNKRYYEDLKQELRLCVFKCIKSYNTSGKAKFNTYAFTSMRNTLTRKLRYQHLIRVPEWTDWESNKIDVECNIRKNVRGDLYNIYDFSEYKDYTFGYRSNIDTAKSILDNVSFKCFMLKLKGYSNIEIGKKIGKSQKQVSNIVASIKNKLKGEYYED